MIRVIFILLTVGGAIGFYSPAWLWVMVSLVMGLIAVGVYLAPANLCGEKDEVMTKTLAMGSILLVLVPMWCTKLLRWYLSV